VKYLQLIAVDLLTDIMMDIMMLDFDVFGHGVDGVLCQFDGADIVVENLGGQLSRDQLQSNK
jgi:hypothetical protein